MIEDRLDRPPGARRRRAGGERTLAAGALVVLASPSVVACGGSDDSGVARADETAAGTTGAVTAPAAEVDRDQALLDFSACMRREGVDFADPVADESGDLQFARPEDPSAFADPAFEDATAACEDLLAGVDTPADQLDDPEFQDAQREFTECLRREGIDVPDFRPGQAPGAGTAGIDVDDPAVRDAIEACDELLDGVGAWVVVAAGSALAGFARRDMLS